jgi:small GTP-binding protein
MCQNRWTGGSVPTVSTAYYTLKGEGDSEEQSVQIWDTAGAERYRALNSVYYHNAMGGILVFDLTCRTSFEALDSWLSEFCDLAQPGALVALVGNKLDLVEGAEERVKEDDARRWAKNHQLHLFLTSAMDGRGIPELTQYILTKLPQGQLMFQPSSVDLGEKGKEAKTSDGCC